MLSQVYMFRMILVSANAPTFDHQSLIACESAIG
jgi:hypothetical protein